MSLSEAAINEMEELVVAKQNGMDDKTPEELAVAHGIASYKRMAMERDELKTHLEKLEQVLTVAKIEIEGLRAEAAAQLTRLESYQHERDEAVGNLAVYQTLFTTLQGVLRTFGIDHAPIVKEVPKKIRG
jgi:hypothetical protein